jgi:Zn-dependent protease with chaperone function
MPEVLDAATSLALVVRSRVERARNAGGAAPLRSHPDIEERLRTLERIVNDKALRIEPRSGQRASLHEPAQD